jgi:hypothetical protein
VERLEDGDDARDGGFDDRSAAQLLFRTDSLGTRSLRQDGAHPGRLCKGNLAQTCVNHERDSNRIIVQTHRYSLTAASNRR